MNDEEALWRLVADPQGERAPIETGLGALLIEKLIGGRGKKGGLSELARQMGLTKQYILQLYQAAIVLTSVFGKPSSQLDYFLDKEPSAEITHTILHEVAHAWLQHKAASELTPDEYEQQEQAAEEQIADWLGR